MNYIKSKIILNEIKKAERILLNCHRGPDPDSIGSVLAMSLVLENMGKKVEIVCPSDDLFDNIRFLKNYNKIQKSVDFAKFDFSKYDLFITLDSSNWDQVLGSKDIYPPAITVIVIDHHKTNSGYGDFNLIDCKTVSTGEIIFWVFEDWQVSIDRDIADCLMTAIIGDSGAFRFPGVTSRTFKTAGALMKKGADKDKIIHSIYRSEDFKLIKFYGEVLTVAEIDKVGNFFWSAIPYSVYQRLGKPLFAKESSATLFAQVVDGTDFGLIAVEREPKKLNVSFRSRTGLDVSKIAMALGGGGHRYAAGGGIEGLSFDEAVKKVLRVARKYARKNSKKTNKKN